MDIRTAVIGSSRPRYGIEAPYVPICLAAGGLSCLAAAMGLRPARWLAVPGLALLAQTGVYLHTTMRGKLLVWERELDGLQLRGDEQLLDLGCGRGAVLIAAAQRLPRGRAVGVDLWRSHDQSGNDPDVTRANARAAGVEDRIELHTADMRALPFPDAGFEVVTSALAIHNIPEPADRARAVDEAVRVLRPAGRLVIADLRHAEDYRRQIGPLAATRSLGPSYWYGGPWAATTVVTATKA